MKKTMLFAILVIATCSCGKLGRGYYCQCTITYAAGSGINTGNSIVKAKAEADCQDKIAEVEADGHSANCAVMEDVTNP